MIVPVAKCPVCGSTTGPWFADVRDGLTCVACAAWAAGYYLRWALNAVGRSFTALRWAPCPRPTRMHLN